jgi:hypothetical protein
MGKGLVSQPSGKGPVADYRRYPVFPASYAVRGKEPKSGGYGSRRMAGIKRVMKALRNFGETRNTPTLAQGMEHPVPPGKEFMSITLMADIPNYFVFRGVKNQVQRYSQFHNTQVGSQMPPVPAYYGNYSFPDFPGKTV